VDEIELSSLDTFAKAEEIARRHKLDLSDSLQLVSVKHGRSSSCVPGFKTVLITADRALASAAKAEGLRVWNCEEEAAPPVWAFHFSPGLVWLAMLGVSSAERL
jgi:hypothetical protein